MFDLVLSIIKILSSQQPVSSQPENVYIFRLKLSGGAVGVWVYLWVYIITTNTYILVGQKTLYITKKSHFYQKFIISPRNPDKSFLAHPLPLSREYRALGEEGRRTARRLHSVIKAGKQMGLARPGETRQHQY